MSAHPHFWAAWAVKRIAADVHRSADTHLLRVDLPGNITAYFKDESTHPTGSLKHRLARSLILYSICNGELGPNMPLVEASSGSTAISLAYFARLLEIPFIAVIPRTTSDEKIKSIQFYGGQVELSEEQDTTMAAAALAREKGGYFCDQFANAAIATDWRGNNNIAESAFAQLTLETHSEPSWIVMAAGTGGTTATFGRWIRYRSLNTKLCLPDPEGSIFHDVVQGHKHGNTAKYRKNRSKGSKIEGIGRPCWQGSFMPQLIDRSERVEDGASGVGMQIASELLGKSVGISTGTHFVQVCRLASEMAKKGKPGSILSVICDSGDRYATTFGDPKWRLYNGMVGSSWERALRDYLNTGKLDEPN